MTHDKENVMVVLSSPSGAGKTTLTKKLQQKFSSFKISVSHTTRKPRLNEIDGIDYNFIDKKSFQEKIDNNFFYEYANIFINFSSLKFDNCLLPCQSISKITSLVLINVFTASLEVP